MKKMILILGIVILSSSMILSADADDNSRQRFEAAHAAYQLDLSARLLEQTVNNYSPITNPNGAATVLTAFDQLANDYFQAMLPIENFMKSSQHSFPDDAQDVLSKMQKAFKSVSLLQTISRGAANASLSRTSYLAEISDVVTYAGAITYVSIVISTLESSGKSEDQLMLVQESILEKAQQTALLAINQKAGDATVIENSDACIAAAGAISLFGTMVQGAIMLAQQYPSSTPYSDAFIISMNQILDDSKQNPLSFEMQQKVYSGIFSPVFAGIFSALANQSALQPYQNYANQSTPPTNAELLILIAKEVAEKVSKMILPDMSTNIVDAMNYASLLNSGLLRQRNFELRDLIFVMQELSGNFQ